MDATSSSAGRAGGGKRQGGKPEEHPAGGAAFAAGAVVLVTLGAPREKFWGMVLEIAPAGVSLRGIELACFDDFAGLVSRGEPAAANAVFFPMHRVERIELDARSGDIPSLRERFRARSGRDLAEVLEPAGDAPRSLRRP